jgi:hypothetical protein
VEKSWGSFSWNWALDFSANPDFDNINFGDLLTLISCVFWAFYITLWMFLPVAEAREKKLLFCVIFSVFELLRLLLPLLDTSYRFRFNQTAFY